MSFKNVEVVKEANIYFDGKVTSRTVLFSDGTKKTLGIMLPGVYNFGTDKAEDMEILAGHLKVKLADSDEWMEITTPTTFNVPAKSSFDLEVFTPTDYCCSYLD